MLTQDFISKDAVLTALRDLPERISMEELFDKIIYIYKIETGLAQSVRGEGISFEELQQKRKSWRKRG